MAVKANRIIRVIIITVMAIATSLLLYLLINNFQFTRGIVVKVHFTSVGDLNAGAWIRKAGIKVGSVTALAPAEDEKTVIVTLTFKPGQPVRRDDRFSLIAKGILGDMYIEQHPGPKESPMVGQGHLFEGEPSFSINDLLGGDTMTAVTDLVGSLKGIVDILKHNEGSLERSIQDIEKTAANVRIVTDRAVQLTDSVPRIASQINESMNQLQVAVTDVSKATERILAKMEGDLVSSSEDLSVSMKSIRQTSSQIQGAVNKLTAEKSVISTLSSPETSQSLSVTLKNMEEISKELLQVSKDAEKVVKDIGKTLGSE